MNTTFKAEHYPSDIAEALIRAARKNPVMTWEMEDYENALYDLMALCENQYNRECYRTLYRLLEAIVDEQESIDRDKEKYVSWDDLTDDEKEMAVYNYADIRGNEEETPCSEERAREEAHCCRGYWVSRWGVTCNI